MRLKYATLVNFVTNFLGLAAGLAFSVLIARKLSVSEFGIWTIIFRYIGYVAPFAVVFTYWLPRTISRGINTAKTGLLLAAGLGAAASLVYIGIALAASTILGQPLLYLLAASIIVFLVYIERCLSSIASSHAPQFTGISGFVSRLARILSAAVFVVGMRLGFLGAIAASITARLSSISLLYRVNRNVIRESRVSVETAKDWLSRSWLPLFANFTNIAMTFDAIVVRCICGSDEPIAYYGISAALLEVATASAYARPALYARLLARGDISDTVEAFWIASLLSIPVSIGLLLYAEPIVLMYGVKYSAISWVVRVFVLSSVLQIILSFLVTTLKGLEARDLYSGENLVGTVLFKVPLVRLFSNALYLLLVGAVAFAFRHDFISLLLGWGIAFNAKLLLELIVYDKLLKREFRVSLPYKSMAVYALKFLLASLCIVLIRILLPIEKTTSIWVLGSRLGVVIALSAAFYLCLLYVIDEKFRDLMHRAINMFTRKIVHE